jgi:hypothetical protein
LYVRESLHSAVVVSKTLKIPTAKSSGYNTDYIVVLIFVLSPDGSIYNCKNTNMLEIIWEYECYKMLIELYDGGLNDGLVLLV